MPLSANALFASEDYKIIREIWLTNLGSEEQRTDRLPEAVMLEYDGK